MTTRVRVCTTPRKSIHHPESATILQTLKNMGFNVVSIRSNKFFEFTLDTDDLAEAERQVRAMAPHLHNPVMEDWSFELNPPEIQPEPQEVVNA